MNKYKTAFLLVCGFALLSVKAQNKPAGDRKLWLNYLDKICRPVLSNLANDKLKEAMPVVLSKRVDNKEAR